jgi:hypothetical protein
MRKPPKRGQKVGKNGLIITFVLDDNVGFKKQFRIARTTESDKFSPANLMVCG